MKEKKNRCIGITNNKSICNRIIYNNNIYCPIHKNKYKKKNSLNSMKSIIKREIIKTISHKSKEVLTDEELIHIHNAKILLTNSFTRCYICNSNNKKCLTIDHIIPLINIENNEYGKDNDANIILCCQKCNMNKSNNGMEYVINEIKKYNKNKKELYEKITAIKLIYNYKEKLLLKKLFIHNFSLFFINNVLKFYQKFICKYMRLCNFYI